MKGVSGFPIGLTKRAQVINGFVFVKGEHLENLAANAQDARLVLVLCESNRNICPPRLQLLKQFWREFDLGCPF